MRDMTAISRSSLRAILVNLSRCFQDELMDNPDPSARELVDSIFGADGKVTNMLRIIGLHPSHLKVPFSDVICLLCCVVSAKA